MPSQRLNRIVKAYDVRGLVPQELDEPVARALGAAFAEVIARAEHAAAVVVAHDMRESSPALASAFAAGVTERGVDVLNAGLSSTDQLYFASGSLGVPAAMFTASHNPASYNGIKLCRAAARPVSRENGLTAVRDLAAALLDGSAGLAGVTTPGVLRDRDVLREYAVFLRQRVGLTGIRPLRVVVDAGNGMAGHTVPAVLGRAVGLPELPVELTPLYFELDGSFPNHEANPLEPANLRDLQAAVRAGGQDLGLAFDGDADRCFVVDEKGDPVSPSAITALIARREVAREVAGGRSAGQVHVVHNVITSAAVPEIIREAGAVPVRTRVGHSFIKADMAAHDAVFGGEHSAHYYFRDFWFADTGMLAALHVLAALGEQSRPLSGLMAGYERYAASGEINSSVPDQDAAVAAVRAWATARSLDVDELDGLTITHRGVHHGEGGADLPASAWWWCNVRASNTEPLLRLNVEAVDETTMARVRDAVLDVVRGTR